jgi:alanine racemase
VAKGFTQKEGINYNKTFSPISSNDSFRIIMTLVTHYDLELYHMDVKTIFLNGDLYENVYMAQTKGFVIEGKIKSIYELKQASRQWYLKFDETVRKFGFKKNDENNCIYAKFKNQKIIFLILISSHFDMKDLDEASYVL